MEVNMKKSIFQSIILLALIMVLACLFYLTPDKKSKNSHPVSSGSVSYIKPGSGIEKNKSTFRVNMYINTKIYSSTNYIESFKI